MMTMLSAFSYDAVYGIIEPVIAFKMILAATEVLSIGLPKENFICGCVLTANKVVVAAILSMVVLVRLNAVGVPVGGGCNDEPLLHAAKRMMAENKPWYKYLLLSMMVINAE